MGQGDNREDFFQYLAKFGKISDKDKRDNVANICVSTLHEALEQFANISQDQGLKQGSDEYDRVLKEFIKRRTDRLTKTGLWVSGKRQVALINETGPIIADVTEAFFGGYSDETKTSALTLLAATLFFKADSPQISGVVIAGFGDDEYFPTLIEHKIDGYVGGSIKRFQVEGVTDLSRSKTGSIRPFAQREMVHRFMSGIDPAYNSYLTNGVPELVLDNCFATLEKYGTKINKTEKIRHEIRDAVNKSTRQFSKEAGEYRTKVFSDPVMRMVAVLPKDELAHLAESLVALTSLKRRVSSDAETVGGPIDVALISKGDGFIWIKRKHYFDNELNPQFVRTYMDRVSNGATMAQNENLLEAMAEQLRPQLVKAQEKAQRKEPPERLSPLDPAHDGVAAARRASEIYRQALAAN